MQRLELTPEEQEILRDVVRQAVGQMEVELLHTDSHGFKEMLKHRRDVLEHIVERLGAPTPLTAAELVAH
jgi:hypothetical protein